MVEGISHQYPDYRQCRCPAPGPGSTGLRWGGLGEEMTKGILIGTLVIAFILIPTQVAHAAYIDPNTGGMLFQLLATVFALLSGFILIFSSRIKIIFARFARFVRELVRRD